MDTGLVHVATDANKWALYTERRNHAYERAQQEAYTAQIKAQILSSQKANSLWASRSLTAPKPHRSQLGKNMPRDHEVLGEGYVRHAVVYENIKREYPGYDTWKTTR